VSPYRESPSRRRKRAVAFEPGDGGAAPQDFRRGILSPAAAIALFVATVALWWMSFW
jgi:hypothetical protein